MLKQGSYMLCLHSIYQLLAGDGLYSNNWVALGVVVYKYLPASLWVFHKRGMRDEGEERRRGGVTRRRQRHGRGGKSLTLRFGCAGEEIPSEITAWRCCSTGDIGWGCPRPESHPGTLPIVLSSLFSILSAAQTPTTVFNQNYAKQITLSYVTVHYKLTKSLCKAEYQSCLGFHCAHNSLSVIFSSVAGEGKSLRRSCVGEVRSDDATGTGPGVKPAPQWSGFLGESKVKLSWDRGIWRPKELSDHHIMFSKCFKLVFSSCANSTTGMSSGTSVAICTETQTSSYRITSMLKVNL